MHRYKVSQLVKGKLVEVTTVVADRFECGQMIGYHRNDGYFFHTASSGVFRNRERQVAAFPDSALFVEEV